MSRNDCQPMIRLLLINPNTNVATTAMMAAIASDALAGLADPAGENVVVEGFTVTRGVPLITDERALNEAGTAVCDAVAAADLSGHHGIIIAAFGDPGLAKSRKLTALPVTGIAEAAMAEAPGRFAVVTTTPALVASITLTADCYGHTDRFAGVYLTPGEPATLMNSPEALFDAMLAACRRAMEIARPDSIVIGGGPLAQIARELRPLITIPVIEPIPAAVRLARSRAGALPHHMAR